MRLKEIFENFVHSDVGVSDTYLNNPDALDQRMNTEIWLANKKQRAKYDPASKSTGIITKYDDSQDAKFTNKPDNEQTASPGFKGRQYTKDFIEKSKKKNLPFFNIDGNESPLSQEDPTNINESIDSLNRIALRLQNYLKKEHPSGKFPVIVEGNNLKIESKSISCNDECGWKFLLEECISWLEKQPGITSVTGDHYANMPREFGMYTPWLELTPKFAITSKSS